MRKLWTIACALPVVFTLVLGGCDQWSGDTEKEKGQKRQEQKKEQLPGQEQQKKEQLPGEEPRKGDLPKEEFKKDQPPKEEPRKDEPKQDEPKKDDGQKNQVSYKCSLCSKARTIAAAEPVPQCCGQAMIKQP